MRKLMLLIATLSLLLIPANAIDISSCQIIDSPGYYTLTNDIIDSSEAECIKITTNNVILNGAGHVIDGIDAQSSYGIYVHTTTTLTNVTVENVTLTDWDSGIYYNRVHGGRIENCTVTSSNTGIKLQSSSSNRVTNNTVSMNGNGIMLYESDSNSIDNNTANMNNYGIILRTSTGNSITNNTVQENRELDIKIWYEAYDQFCNNILTNNVGSGDRAIKYFNSQVNLENESLSELILCNADHSNISNVTIKGSDSLQNNGLLLIRTDNTNISGVTSSNNLYGIFLYLSKNNTVKSNVLSSNSYGIYLYSSSGNLIYNNLFNNANNAYFSAINANTWNITKTSGKNIVGGSILGGNYWGKPDGTGFSETCHDSDGDGICDSAYLLAEDNEDYLPLAKAKAGEAHEITSCQIIDAEGYYTLANDITDTTTSSACLWIKASNVTIDGSGHAISGSPSGLGILMGSNQTKVTNVTIKNIRITNWYAGISVKHAENVKILNATVEDGRFGISLGDPLKTSGLIRIDNCTIRNNTDDGIGIGYNVNDITVTNSTIVKNHYGINYGQTNVYNPELTVYNNIFNNTENVYSQVDFSAKWNTSKKAGINIVGGSYLGGNAWLSQDGNGFSQTCFDSDNDGICDDPYQINSKSTDFLPLAVQGQAPPPIQEYQISGKIFYFGEKIGKIFIDVSNSCDFSHPLYSENISSPGDYSINVTEGSYYVRAYMDVNGNDVYDDGEPHGYAINKTNCSNADVINVASDLSGINIILFERDTTPPVITFVNPTPANNSVINKNYVFVNITSNEPLSNALLNWNGANITMNGQDRNWYYNVAGLSDGTYKFKVYGKDLAGNWNVTETRVVTISRPHVEDNYILRIRIVTNSGNPKKDAFSIDLSIVSKKSIVMEEGVCKIYLTSNKPVHALIPHIKDETPPTIVFVNPTPVNNSILSQSYIFVNVKSNEPLSNALLNWNGVNLTMHGQGKNWHYNVTSLTNGVYRFKVYGKDLAGNWNATETRIVMISIPEVVKEDYILNISVITGKNIKKSDGFKLSLSSKSNRVHTLKEKNYDIRISTSGVKSNMLKSQHLAIKGDFNDNGRIDIGDVVYVAYMVLRKIPEDTKADFNNNGKVDIGDLAKIAYYFLGKINEL